jgi:hypothetical protein
VYLNVIAFNPNPRNPIAFPRTAMGCSVPRIGNIPGL